MDNRKLSAGLLVAVVWLSLPMSAQATKPFDDHFTNDDPWINDGIGGDWANAGQTDGATIAESGSNLVVTAAGGWNVVMAYTHNDQFALGSVVTYTLGGLTAPDSGDTTTWDNYTMTGHAIMTIGDWDYDPAVGEGGNAYKAEDACLQVSIRRLTPGQGSDYLVVLGASGGYNFDSSMWVSPLSWDGASDLQIALAIGEDGDSYALEVGDTLSTSGRLTEAGLLTFDQPFWVGVGLQPIGGNAVTASYDRVYVGQDVLVPDDFELYPDDPNLSLFWSAPGTVTVETTEVYAGDQAMKAVLSSAGFITKRVMDPNNINPLTFDYTAEDGRDLLVWFKGEPGNATGDVELAILDDNNNVLFSETSVAGTAVTDWSAIRGSVNTATGDWANVAAVRIYVGAPATLHIDELSFKAPDLPAQKVMEWRFDETSGFVAEDSVGDNDGTLGPEFTGAEWANVNGRSGLEFGADPNYRVVNDSVTLPAGVGNIFEAESSWSMNQWIYLNSASDGHILGGFGNIENFTTNGEARYVNIGGGGSLVFRAGNSPYYWSTSASMDVGEWMMITVTYDKWSKSLKVYKNAEQVLAASSVSFPANAQPIFAVAPRSWEATFDGLISDFAIWDQALPFEDEDSDPANDVLSLWGTYICDTTQKPALDLNDDCIVDFVDFAIFVQSWLDCTRYPDSYCH